MLHKTNEESIQESSVSYCMNISNIFQVYTSSSEIWSATDQTIEEILVAKKPYELLLLYCYNFIYHSSFKFRAAHWA